MWRRQRPMSLQGPTSSIAALSEREIGIGDEPLRIEGVDFAEAVALSAHALRAVEAEELRAGRIEAEAAMGAGVVGGEG